MLAVVNVPTLNTERHCNPDKYNKKRAQFHVKLSIILNEQTPKMKCYRRPAKRNDCVITMLTATVYKIISQFISYSQINFFCVSVSKIIFRERSIKTVEQYLKVLTFIKYIYAYIMSSRSYSLSTPFFRFTYNPSGKKAWIMFNLIRLWHDAILCIVEYCKPLCARFVMDTWKR